MHAKRTLLIVTITSILLIFVLSLLPFKRLDYADRLSEEVLIVDKIDYDTMIEELKAKQVLDNPADYVVNTDEIVQYYRILQGVHGLEDYLPVLEIYASMNMKDGQPVSFNQVQKVILNETDYYNSELDKAFYGSMFVGVNKTDLLVGVRGMVADSDENYQYEEQTMPINQGDYALTYFSSEPIEVAEDGTYSVTYGGDQGLDFSKNIDVSELVVD